MKKVILITGMPRSGTSFVGQIFDSNPNTAFRMEPLFSYKLKNLVDENSSKSDYLNFFTKAYDATDDEFMNQLDKRESNSYPIFKKLTRDILVIKTTRHHHLLPTLLNHFDESFLRIVSIVRHPCGAISSWLNHPNEFHKHCDRLTDWRTGNCRKTAKEEFWGFNDWKSIMFLHQKYEDEFPNFKIFQYEDIVRNISNLTDSMFDFTKISRTEQTDKFLIDAQNINRDDPYSVYKNPNVSSKWKRVLEEEIVNQIINECKNCSLNKYLVEY